MFVDSILFISIIITLQLIKQRNPNFLFFCKGAILFIPPAEDPTAPLNKNKKHKQQEQQLSVKIMKVQYNEVKDCPKKQQYERIIFMIASLAIYLPIRIIGGYLWVFISGSEASVHQGSSLFSLICLFMLMYVVKIGIEIFQISSYNIKMSLCIVFGLNLLFFILLISLSGTSAVDNTLQESLLDYQKQLKIIFGRQINSQILGPRIVILVLLVFNGVLGLVCIPAIIKFGNWYTKTLKEVYYEEEEGQVPNDDPEVQKQKAERQKLLKIKSASTIKQLNFYLVASLIFLFFSHRFSHQYLPEGVVDLLRSLLICFMIYINISTLKDAIEFNGSFAYKSIAKYFQSEDPEQKQELRKKIFHYIQMIWYFKFQLMFRIIIPVILFMMLINCKYLENDANKFESISPTVMENSCGIFTGELNILEDLYHCDYTLADTATINHIQQNSYSTINGVMVGKQMISNGKVTQQRVGKYGLFYKGFVVEALQTIQWFLGIMLYGFTIIYILFLRKTVYDI